VGVKAEADAELVLRRNLIWSHNKGGVETKGPFTIENNFVVKNGAADKNFGGVKFAASAVGSFVNNTVAENMSKASNPDEAIIRCDDTIQIYNNIVWGNTLADTKAKQLDPDCQPFHCDVEDLAGTLTNGNIKQDPQLKGGTGPGADPWHLKATSPCNGKADPANAPKVDYDGQARSSTAPDIGADEI
jgi:hypothetical protein